MKARQAAHHGIELVHLTQGRLVVEYLGLLTIAYLIERNFLVMGAIDCSTRNICSPIPGRSPGVDPSPRPRNRIGHASGRILPVPPKTAAGKIARGTYLQSPRTNQRKPRRLSCLFRISRGWLAEAVTDACLGKWRVRLVAVDPATLRGRICQNHSRGFFVMLRKLAKELLRRRLTSEQSPSWPNTHVHSPG